MCRKEGKLPPPTSTYGYNTEYSKDVLELKEGSGEVVIVDDVLATGGTIQTVNRLVENAGYNVVGNVVLIDLRYVPIDNFGLIAKVLIMVVTVIFEKQTYFNRMASRDGNTRRVGNYDVAYTEVVGKQHLN